MRNKIINLLLLFLLWAPHAFGQGCYPGNNPTVAVSNVQVLDPAAAASQGLMTITNDIYATNVSSGLQSIPSHVATYTEGTWVGIDVKTRNAQSRSWYFTVNGGPQQGYGLVSGFSGTQAWTNPNAWLATAADVGNTITYVNTAYTGLNGTGTSTQEKVSFTIAAGSSPSVVSQDQVGSDGNIYYVITTTYSGMPQILFSDCPHMQNAHHTPRASLQVQSSSGEVHVAALSTGATVPANTSVYAVVTDAISANVGDSITASYGGSMWCDLIGAWVWESLVSFRIEYAQVVAKDLGHPPRPGSEQPVPSVIYDVATICDNNSDPADWQPTVVHSWSGRHTYWWGATSLFRAPDLAGIPFIPLASYMNDFIHFDNPQGGPIQLAELVVVGGAIPYPGPAPKFPIPAPCTQYPKNVLLTLSSNQIPWWPFNN